MGSYPIWKQVKSIVSSAYQGHTHTHTHIAIFFLLSFYYLYQNFGILKRMQRSTNTQSHTKFNQTISLSVFIMLLMGWWFHCVCWIFVFEIFANKIPNVRSKISTKIPIPKTFYEYASNWFSCMDTEYTLLQCDYEFGSFWQFSMDMVRWYERDDDIEIRNCWQFACVDSKYVRFWLSFCQSYVCVFFPLPSLQSRYIDIALVFHEKLQPNTQILAHSV